MRTTKDLIEELESESSKFWLAALAVGFEKHTEFVFSTDKDKLAKLNRLVQSDGEPVGLIGVTLEKRLGTFYCRPLVELKQESWVAGYLSALLTQIKAGILATGEATDLDAADGWVN